MDPFPQVTGIRNLYQSPSDGRSRGGNAEAFERELEGRQEDDAATPGESLLEKAQRRRDDAARRKAAQPPREMEAGGDGIQHIDIIV